MGEWSWVVAGYTVAYAGLGAYALWLGWRLRRARRRSLRPRRRLRR